MTNRSAGAIERGARQELRESLEGPDEPTPLLDAVDELAGNVTAGPILDRLEDTDGKVALYLYGPADNELWIRYYPEVGKWEGKSRYPSGAWSSTVVESRTWPQLWVNETLQDADSIDIGLIEERRVPWSER